MNNNNQKLMRDGAQVRDVDPKRGDAEFEFVAGFRQEDSEPKEKARRLDCLHSSTKTTALYVDSMILGPTPPVQTCFYSYFFFFFYQVLSSFQFHMHKCSVYYSTHGWIYSHKNEECQRYRVFRLYFVDCMIYSKLSCNKKKYFDVNSILLYKVQLLLLSNIFQ